MRPLTTLLFLACSLGLVACDPVPPDNGVRPVVDVPTTPAQAETPARFQVRSQGSFKAGYDSHEREILIITDKATGHKYLGITGVGITELWHSGGKTDSTVEE